jgi:hypothetical protein
MVLNEWPHEAPRKDGTQEQRNIHNVWTNHACSHVCQTEVEIQAVFVHCTKKYKENKIIRRRRIERAAGGRRIKGGGPRQMVFSKTERNYMHTWILTACTFL